MCCVDDFFFFSLTIDFGSTNKWRNFTWSKHQRLEFQQMKLCKLAKTTILTVASTSIGFVLQIVTVVAIKQHISGKKTMIPMVVFILFGVSMNLVRAENQYRQQQRYQNTRQQQRLQPNVSDLDLSASYYYECVSISKSRKNFFFIAVFDCSLIAWKWNFFFKCSSPVIKLSLKLKEKNKIPLW